MAPGIDITEFLNRKGAIQFIHALAQEDGAIVEEIHQEINVSRQTTTNLLQEAREKDIVRLVFSDADHNNAKRFVLTTRGLRLYVMTKELGVYETYKEWKALEEEYEKKRAELAAWADDEYFDPSHLNDPDWNKVEWKDLRPPHERPDTDDDE